MDVFEANYVMTCIDVVSFPAHTLALRHHVRLVILTLICLLWESDHTV
jgi:hypothetical protein